MTTKEKQTRIYIVMDDDHAIYGIFDNKQEAQKYRVKLEEKMGWCGYHIDEYTVPFAH